MKNGDEHLASLRDNRDVYILGQRVADVTAHRAFRNSVAAAARLYDFQQAPENVQKMTFVSPRTGDRVNRCWQLPRSYGELVERREALAAWAETHFGFMGRSPDHVASCLSGMVMGIEQFEAYSPERARALYDYYEYARDRDLFVTYVIVNPQGDRSKSAHEQAEPGCFLRLYDRDSRGITVAGAKMLGTSAIMANEVFVPPGYPPGIEQKILAGRLDEQNKTGSRTRLLRFRPGAYTTAPFVHEYWEEVFLVSGDLVVGSDAQGSGGENFSAHTYACRPPGVFHGPFKSETGCLLLEVHYFL